MEITVGSVWRHIRRPERKVRVDRIWDVHDPDKPAQRGVKLSINDPMYFQPPWTTGTTLFEGQFLDTYEPDEHSFQEQATALIADLIASIEVRCVPELTELRARIAKVEEYMDLVVEPGMDTLGHIRKMLRGEQ